MERNEVEYFLSASAYGILNRTIAMSGLENKTRNYTPALAIVSVGPCVYGSHFPIVNRFMVIF